MTPIDPDRTTPPRLLLVDDDPTTLRLLAEVLRKDYSILVATNGRDALALAQQDPALILLDLDLPDIGGIEVLRTLKGDSLRESIPVIMVTATQDAGVEEEAINLGAVDFVHKPFSAAVLRARVHTQIKVRRQREALDRLVLRDALTGVANRRCFDATLAQEWARQMRAREPLSMIMFDIDHFKRLNDSQGHLAGDEQLIATAQAVGTLVHRTGDLLARLGGEEFGVLLPGSDLDGSLHIAEGIRRMIEMKVREGALACTVSLGCASLIPGPELKPSDLVSLADQKLYAAKAAGRNRVEPQPAPLP